MTSDAHSSGVLMLVRDWANAEQAGDAGTPGVITAGPRPAKGSSHGC
jgi:hypothetical protein